MLRAREPQLLNAERAQRMLDAPGFEEAAKLLTDCGYPDMAQMKADEIEQTLAERRNAVLGEIASLAPDKSIVTAFRVKYDYHNVKAILKAAAMDSDPGRLLTAAGRVPVEKLLSAYQESRYVELPAVLGKAMEEAFRWKSCSAPIRRAAMWSCPPSSARPWRRRARSWPARPIPRWPT